jgi:hypothetical protein
LLRGKIEKYGIKVQKNLRRELMSKLIERDAFKDIEGRYTVDWGATAALSESLDNKDNYSGGEHPFTSVSCILLLGIYGALTRESASAPKGQKLTVVVWPPQVFFCPSFDGADGVFIEKYDEEKHGKNCFILHKESNIWDFTSAHALRDGWEFNAAMIFEESTSKRAAS